MRAPKDAPTFTISPSSVDSVELDVDMRGSSHCRTSFWRLISPWVIPLGICAVWWAYSHSGQLGAGMVPTIEDTWHTFLRLLRDGTYWNHLTSSVWRVIGGFVIAASLAIPLGMVVGSHAWCRRVLHPTLEFLRQIPPVALVPLLIVWLGLGETPKLVVIAYAAFFPIFLNTEAAVASIDKEYREVAEVLRLSRRRRVTKLLLPASSVGIVTGLRLGLGFSWRALVAAEMLAAYSGLGYLIMSARALVRMEEMVIGILSVGFLGVLMDRLGWYLQRRVQPWLSAGGRRYGS